MAMDKQRDSEEPVDSVVAPYIRPQQRKAHDTDVKFEEYAFYARATRKEQAQLAKPKTKWKEVLFNKTAAKAPDGQEANESTTEHESHSRDFEINTVDRNRRLQISDKEWTDASRAFRSASAGACFYLITTDILGPFGVGFALGTLGWGPGIALYTVFGFMAGYSGYLLYHIFLGLDSFEFPLSNYGDLAFRVYGNWARHIVNILQALALILILGQVTIQNAQALSEVSRFRLCYAVCPIIFIACGFFLGQIRTLRNYGWVANLAVWLNMMTIFISMGVIANSPPNYEIATLGSAGSAVDPASITPVDGVYPPILHYAGLPDPNSLVGAINGLLSGVLAYAGAQLFIEFMAEMRRPTDFIKAMWGAQFFIYTVYLVYGSFVYYYQGQYAFTVSYQGVSPYGWQTAGNMISFVSGLIAAGLYGNIGLKVLYNNLLIDWFSAPPLYTHTGKILWAVLVPIWWSIAYVIAAAIPDYIGFVSVMSAATLMNLVYSIPPVLAVGFDVRLNAMRAHEDNGFNPQTGEVTRHLSGIQYWLKGFLSGGPFQILMNTLNVLYFLAALAMSGLGLYAAIVGLIDAFKMPQVNAFSCHSPLNLG